MTRVLLIEDDPWLADSFAHILASQDIEVQVVHDASAAIDVIDATPPDLIVADVILGEANVVALLHELQSYQDTQRIPVVLCTTLDLSNQQKAGSLQPYGVHEVLDKATLTPDRLHDAIRSVLHGVRHP